MSAFPVELIDRNCERPLTSFITFLANKLSHNYSIPLEDVEDSIAISVQSWLRLREEKGQPIRNVNRRSPEEHNELHMRITGDLKNFYSRKFASERFRIQSENVPEIRSKILAISCPQEIVLGPSELEAVLRVHGLSKRPEMTARAIQLRAMGATFSEIAEELKTTSSIAEKLIKKVGIKIEQKQLTLEELGIC